MENSQKAWQALQESRIAEAERLGRLGVQRSPNDVEAHQVLALACNTRGAYREAVKSFRRITELEPAQFQNWANLGTALRTIGDLDGALAAYQKVFELGERGPDIYFNLGLLQLDRQAYVPAQQAFAVAAPSLPFDAEVQYYYARSCYDCVLNDEARAAILRWRSFEGLNGDLMAKIAALLIQLGETPEAQLVLQQAQAREPDNSNVNVCMIWLAERTNQLDLAQQTLERTRPQFAGASDQAANDLLCIEAQLAQRAGRHEEARDKFLSVLRKVTETQDRELLQFPLAKSYDALGDYEAAFAMLTEAHEAQVEYLQKSAPRFQTLTREPMAITMYGCDAADVAAWNAAPPHPGYADPVFVVAFPRSGTTLLEQMLDAHPLLRSMDEQPFLQNAIECIGELGVQYPDQLAQLSEAQIDTVRERYWSLVAKKVKVAPGERLVDKNPLNLLRLPAIARLFPKAKIILAVRHPCDVMMSCFMQHFRAPDFAGLCRNLPLLGVGYRRAFDFWYAQAALLQPDVLEVRYESLVSDFEAHARSIATFLELPWNEAMLSPGKRARERGFISTPSYWQVVQPVNTKAIDRWRRYEKHFAEVIPEIRPYLDRYGYQA